MLCIVKDPTHSAKDTGEGGADKTDRSEQQQDPIAKVDNSLHGNAFLLNYTAARHGTDRLGRNGRAAKIRGGPLKVAATPAATGCTYMAGKFGCCAERATVLSQ